MLSYGEKLLRAYVKRCFPKEIILYNYREAGIINPDTGFPLEIDIFLPRIKIGFEFQGRQHKTLEEQKRKDKEKRKQAKKLGITLIEIWTATLEQDIYTLIKEKVPKEIEVKKPNYEFRKNFEYKAKNYKSNIYKMNKKLNPNFFSGGK